MKRGREKAFLGVADSGRGVAEWQRSGRANVEVAVPGAGEAKRQKGKKTKRLERHFTGRLGDYTGDYWEAGIMIMIIIVATCIAPVLYS